MDPNSERENSIKSLIELGTKGFFPLFEKGWPTKLIDKGKKLTLSERLQAKKLFKRIRKHQSIERQRSVLFSMKEEERSLVIKALLNMVEKRLRHQNKDVH